MKKVLGLGLALLASQAAANTFEVSLFYPDAYDADPNYEVSAEVVGFYRSLEIGNKLFADNGVNLTLKPVGVIATNSWDGSESVDWGQATMTYDGGAGIDIETNVGDMSVGIFTESASALALAEAMLSSYYTDHPTGTRKIAMGYGVMLGTNDQTGLPYTLAHEILHTIGGEHEHSNDFNNDGLGRVDGYGKVCDNGYSSLMHTNIASTPYANMTMTGAVGCQDAQANMIDFVNHYAPLASNYASTIGNQTITLDVTEDVDNQVFTFSANRSDSANAETMTLYVAGGYAKGTGTSLEPIAVEFVAGQTKSELVEVTFTDLHPLFEYSSATDVQSVYAVVIGNDEVQEKSVDIMALNTQWTETVPPVTDPVEPSETPSQGGSGGGGGSMPLWLLPTLLVVRHLRK